MVWKLIPGNAEQSDVARAYSDGHIKQLDENTEQIFLRHLFTPPGKHTSSHYHRTIFDTSHTVRNGELSQLLPYRETSF